MVYQAIQPDQQTLMTIDTAGMALDLNHAAQPVQLQGQTPREVADAYLQQQANTLMARPESLTNLSREAGFAADEETVGYRFENEKSQFDVTTVGYQQTYFGIPVWNAGVAVQVKHGPYRVVSSQNTASPDVAPAKPTDEALTRMKALKPAELAVLLGIEPKGLTINARNLYVFQYLKAKRTDDHGKHDKEQGEAFAHFHLDLPLPPVAKGIKNGQYYVAEEFLFTLPMPTLGEVNWRAFVEVETGSVLHLRALIDNANGLVFETDPITRTGNPATGPAAAAAVLDPLRQTVALPLGPPVAGTQALTGQFIRVNDFETPTIAVPTRPAGSDFNFGARTNGFAAVNAYYNNDRFFRLLQSLGFNVPAYFNNTTFPVQVDHRGHRSDPAGNEINAYCGGNGTGNGIGRLGYMLANTADTANPISIAADYRVVLHELGGHGILWDNVSSPNFGFAHSAGDSIAAILHDPDTQATDRFQTFPWTLPTSRRHDRPVASGWGWGGSNDTGGYNSEQILSTTLFRLYRSMGGDSASLNRRRFAARFATYLIVRAVGSLTPATNPTNAAGLAAALMTADLGDWTSAGQAGGAYSKVIRWAFEKQGLYKAPGAPANSVGAPPPVDVYIQDGRNGEYPFLANHWSNQSVWNRRAADGGTTHQEPIVGQPNFAYVKVKNRGTQTATGVIVKGYHCNPGTGLTWPTDWQPMTTAQLAGANIAANNAAEITVGPFQWTPSQVGHECMLMIASANGDPSNINNFSAGDTIPEWRLVPHDNNIGQRNVHPIAGTPSGILKALNNLPFLIRNPFPDQGDLEIRVQMPKFLLERDWKVSIADEPDRRVIKKGERVVAKTQVTAGRRFTRAELANERDLAIVVETYINGELTGGMTYLIEPKLRSNQPIGELRAEE
jgi:zinc metalloprotease ZmpB